MARKSNIRSIRFSDEIAELIDRQQGDNFTQKFENLITKCAWELPARERELAELEKRIAEKRRQLLEMSAQARNQREEYGHWEIDLVVGKAKTTPVLLTMAERQSREPMIFKLPNKKAASVRRIFDMLERTVPDFQKKFKSITTDNGSEFLEYDQLIQSIYGGERFSVYYCHSYSAWEKGGNENMNRMLRRWFPKGTDFSRVTKKEIAEFQDWLYHYPRKILGWKSPAELAICGATTSATPSGEAPSGSSC